jgi:hypothetical protein
MRDASSVRRTPFSAGMLSNRFKVVGFILLQLNVVGFTVALQKLLRYLKGCSSVVFGEFGLL